MSHQRSFCFNVQNKKANMSTKSKKRTHLQWSWHTASPLEWPSDEKTEIYNFNISNKNGLPTQHITINKPKLNILIDSGSTLNIINEKVFNSTAPTPKLKPSKVTIYPYQATATIRTFRLSNNQSGKYLSIPRKPLPLNLSIYLNLISSNISQNNPVGSTS